MLLKMFLTVSILSLGAVYAAEATVNQNGVNIKVDETSSINTAYKLSSDLVNLTLELAKLATINNETSQKSMLQLSQDIGDMADRINEMADKINVMADKIVETQRIQSKNLETTQNNMLEAQKNILSALSSIDFPQLKENLNKSETVLKDAIEKNSINMDILNNLDLNYLISKINHTPIKYRYKYMNAVKEMISKDKETEREKKIEKIVAKIRKNREKIQQKEEKSYMETLDSSINDGFDTGMDSGVSDGGMSGGSSSGGMGGGRF